MEPEDGLQMPPRMLVNDDVPQEAVERILGHGWTATDEYEGNQRIYVWADAEVD